MTNALRARAQNGTVLEVVPGVDIDDLADDDPDNLWAKVLSRQPPAYARLVNFPPDLSHN